MPTGYTEPILKGKITNFKDYAKLCMRAFGATIHMRDDSLDVEYEERVPSNYHLDSLKECQTKLSEFLKMTDDEVLEWRKKQINDDIEYHQKKIIDCNKNSEMLHNILNEVNGWEPPTTEHTGIKKFMTEQITETLKYDADSKYHKLEIRRYDEKLNNINVEEVKIWYVEKMEKDIKYHIENYEQEKTRSEEANKWVKTFLKSL